MTHDVTVTVRKLPCPACFGGGVVATNEVGAALTRRTCLRCNGSGFKSDEDFERRVISYPSDLMPYIAPHDEVITEL